MELHALSTSRKPRIVTVMTMLKQMPFRYQGYIGAALAHLFTIHPHGSTDKLPLPAMAVFESSWKLNMSREDTLQLVNNAISAGIFNDLGSSSNVDACIITASHMEMLRNVEMPNECTQKERQYGFRHRITALVMSKVTLLGAGDEMDTT
ncbi:20S proteasome subunit [Mycena sanguinolenta]|nr:20S proteasome subunit [Mycena sanguinolenta]